MSKIVEIRSVSFDTSFLLKDNSFVDLIIKKLSQDNIQCFITSTVISEIEQLKMWNRILTTNWKMAYKRINKVNAKIIDFKNRFLSDVFGRNCMESMKKHHGVKSEDIRNDCRILVSTLKNGIDLFISEDFHFTSNITSEVIQEIENNACKEYSQICDSILYITDTRTFLESYNTGNIDLEIVRKRMKTIRKKGKRM